MPVPKPLLPEPAAGLPARDAWLLPLISVMTVLVMLVGAELAARLFYPEQMENACRMADPVVGHRYRANCSAVTKTAEGPWVTNDYNECGYRSAAPCGPTAPGTRRVALIGSSLSEGYMVEYASSVGPQLSADLTRLCGAPVEVQNLGGVGYSGARLIPRMAEALRLHPQAVLLLLAPFDMEDELGQPAALGEAVAAPGVQKRVFDMLKSSRAVLVAQHYLFQNPRIYLPLYLRYGDKADFLRPPFSENWQLRLRAFDALLAQLSGQAHAAGVPFAFAFVPQEAQVALMAGRPIPPGVDPQALPRALQAVAASHDVQFVDASVALRAQPAPERLFYQVDGHLSGRGQPIAAAAIAAALVQDAPGPFAGCRNLATAMAASRG